MSGVLQDIAIKRSPIYHIDPRVLKIKENWNARNPDDPDNSAHIMSLAYSIAEVGVLQPLTVFREGETVYVSDGHCRLAATLFAIEHLGAPIESVPVQTEGRQANEADYVFRQLLDGKPKTPLELGSIYKRLVGYGWPIAAIAAKSGKSVSSVNDALNLQGAHPDVQKLVASGRVAPTAALKAVKTDGAKAPEALAKAVDHATQRGAAKATVRDLGGEAKEPRKQRLTRVSELIEEADVLDGFELADKYKDNTIIVMTDDAWRELQKLLEI
jgi:ParB-like chromosome segregation protein Spo0J